MACLSTTYSTNSTYYHSQIIYLYHDNIKFLFEYEKVKCYTATVPGTNVQCAIYQ